MTEELGAPVRCYRMTTNEKGPVTMKLTTITQVSVDGVMQANGGRDEKPQPMRSGGGPV